MLKIKAPTTPQDYLSLGLKLVPVNPTTKKPTLEDWPNIYETTGLTIKDFKNVKSWGLLLDEHTDLDIDNPKAIPFIKRYLKHCTAEYGRKSNPNSHFLFKNKLEQKKFDMPEDLKKYCKGYPHGSHLGQIRSGHGFQSIVPGGLNEDELVEWATKDVVIKKYNGDLEKDFGKIMLATALVLCYPDHGKRDDYCFAIACILADNTKWSDVEIDDFVYEIAIQAKDINARDRIGKGTNARKPKGNKMGLPTIADAVGIKDKSSIMDLFEWVGCTYKGGHFTELKCIMTIPKYWELKYKDHWLRIMDTAVLMSYAKLSVLIEENCFETAPEITPKEWKEIRQGLYKKVKKIDVPYEQSFFGVVAQHFSDFCRSNRSIDKRYLFDNFRGGGCWHDTENKQYVFKLEAFTDKLRARRISFEQRQLTAMLREKFGAETSKMTLDKKEIRVWLAPMEKVDDYDNTDTKAVLNSRKPWTKDDSF
jgi:hypothetical protein